MNDKPTNDEIFKRYSLTDIKSSLKRPKSRRLSLHKTLKLKTKLRKSFKSQSNLQDQLKQQAIINCDKIMKKIQDNKENVQQKSTNAKLVS
jgi:uncharacterized protein (DUF342 family)